MKLRPPKRIHRTTIYDLLNDDPEITGVYIIAYLGKIIYVGRSADVTKRLTEHYLQRSKFGGWMANIYMDWINVRVDILEPDISSDEIWMKNAERACIRKFRPLINSQCKPKLTTEFVINTANLSF